MAYESPYRPLSWDDEPDDEWQIKRGWKAGVDQVQGLGYGAMALVGDAIGSEDLLQSGMEGYERNMAEAAQHAGKVTSYQDIEGVNDLADYVLYGLGTLAPTMLTAFAGGGIGGVAAKVGLKKAIASTMTGSVKKRAAAIMAESGIAKAAAQQQAVGQLASIVGGTVGAATATSGMEAGGIFTEIYDETGQFVWDKALVGGIAAGALDVLPVVSVFKKLGVGEMAKKGITGILLKNKALSGALQTALYEGSTEGVQTIIEKASIKWVDDNYEVFSEQNITEIIDASLLGAIGGVAMGAPAGAIEGLRTRDTTPPPGPTDAELAGDQAAQMVASAGGDQLAQTEARVAAIAQVEGESPPMIAKPGEDALATTPTWEQFVANAGLGEINQEVENADRLTALQDKQQQELTLLEKSEAFDVRNDELVKEAEVSKAWNQNVADDKLEASIDRNKEKFGLDPDPLIPPTPTNTAMADALAKAGVVAPTVEEVDEAAHEAQSSPTNDLPEPSESQIEAGNYKKGHVNVQGLDITVENPEGSTRKGTDETGRKWSTKLNNHYGYIKRTEGADGDQVDVFMGKNPESDQVFIVNQVDQKTGEFDEHKVMIGFNNKMQAMKAYRENYDKAWKVGEVDQKNMGEFKQWLSNEDTTVDSTLGTTDEVVSEDDFNALTQRYEDKTGKKPRIRFAKGTGDPIPFSNTLQGRVSDLKQAQKVLQDERQAALELMQSVDEMSTDAHTPTSTDPATGVQYDDATVQQILNSNRFRFAKDSGSNEAHQVAQRKATIPTAEGGLGLPANNTAMERAEAENFDIEQTWYHGSSDNIQEFKLGHQNRKDAGWLGEGVYLFNSGIISSQYAKVKPGDASPNVMPLLVKKGNFYKATIEDKFRIQNIENSKGREAASIASKELTDRLVAEGYDGVILNYSHKENGQNPVELVVFDPANVRSVNAAFDPTQQDSSDLLFAKNYKKAVKSLNEFDGKEQKIVSAIAQNEERVVKLKAQQKEAAIPAEEKHRINVREAIGGLQKALPMAKIQVIDNIESLPEDMQARVPSSEGYKRNQMTYGLYDSQTGISYVVADNTIDVKHAMTVGLHEAVGHHGVQTLLGENYGKIMDEVFSSNQNNSTLQSIAANYKADLATERGQRLAADEYVAYIAEKTEGDLTQLDRTLMQRVIAAVREVLRSYGIKVKWTDDDIKSLLSRSATHLGRRPLSAIELTDKFNVEGTTEEVTVTQNAEVALRRLDKRMSMLEELKVCVNG